MSRQRLNACEAVWRKEFATFPRTESAQSGAYGLSTVCGNIYTLRATGRDLCVGALATLRVSDFFVLFFVCLFVFGTFLCFVLF